MLSLPEPGRMPLPMRDNGDASAFPFEALFAARQALFGPIPVAHGRGSDSSAG